jgi:hypothetical protein
VLLDLVLAHVFPDRLEQLEAPGGLRTADAPKPLLLAARSRCARQERNRSPQALADDRVVVGEENPGRV